MLFSSWLDSVRNRLLFPRRRRSTSLSRIAERLEDRTLLAVSALFLSGELTVTSDGDDSIRVSALGGNVLIEEAPPGGTYSPLSTLPTVGAGSVTKLVVQGGDGANVIDVGGVSSSAFSSQLEIVIQGGDGADDITGSSDLGDSILGGDGADTLDGQGGNDTIDGGNSGDLVNGGKGDDSLVGEDGADSIQGDDGNDTLDGGDGTDSLNGDAGNDSLLGGSGKDTLAGDDGNDTLSGGSANDELQGNAGNDSAVGGSGADLLVGNDGNDTLNGNSGRDTIQGNDGDDFVVGGSSNDDLSGGDGNDLLNGNSSGDTLDAGKGNDTLFGGSGNDLMNGGEGNDTLRGNGGHDTLLGGGGQDLLDGSAGDDLVDSANQKLSINDVTADPEGDSGTSNAVFTVSLAEATVQTVTVDFATADGTAKAGVDYQTTAGTLTFAAGQIVQTISVPVIGDTVFEPDETFFVNLSNPTNSPIADGQGQATIVDDDATPISIDDVTVNPEGDTGSTNAVFTVSLGSTSNLTVTVDFATANGSAQSGTDYTSQSGTLTFVSGQTTQTVSVPVFGDALNEANETYFVNLSNATNAQISDAQGLGTIVDDDGVAISIDDVTVGAEGNSGTTNAVFTVTLSAAAGVAVTVDFATANGTATAGSDYTATNGTLTFAAGVLTQTVTVSVTGDTTVENDEDFFVNLSNAANAAIADGQGRGLIVDDDGSDFDIVITFSGGLTASQQTIFTTAENRWEKIITGDIPDITIGAFGLIDDVTIDARGLGIDGPFGVLGSAGPTNLRPGTFLPATGRMQFDTADLSRLEANGELENVILHEMAHVLGFGTIWELKNLLTGKGTSDPRFTGTQAVNEHNTRFSANDTGVPLETMGGQGTRDSHWLEATYTNELMTGFLNSGVNPISRVTIAQFADLGYQVNFGQADPFIVAGSVQALQSEGATTSQPAVFVNAADDTLLGRDGRDTLLGGSSNDSLNGGRGNDSMNGGGGNDTLLGGTGRDTMDGGDGNDTLDGQGGADNKMGGAGDDTYLWRGSTSASDTLTNTAGFDTVQIIGGAAAETFTVGQSGSQLQVTFGTATLSVGSKITNVVIDAGDGDDTIDLNSTDNVPAILLTVNAEGGNDVADATGARFEKVRVLVNGGIGDDTLTGGVDGDLFDGGDGNDLLVGGTGNDTLLGGLGDDSLSGQDGNDRLKGGEGNDTLLGEAGNDTLQGEDGNDFMNGGAGNDQLEGNAGRDTLNGSSGNDSLSGDAGRDTLFGGSGNDTLDGGLDNDSLKGHSGNDKLRGGDGDDTLRGVAGDDYLNGGDGDDRLFGGKGNDGLAGKDGNDFINGGSGSDTATGGDGDDSMLGGSGKDILLAENGDDRVNGQGSSDTIAGGEGDDTLIGTSSEIDELFTLSNEVLALLDAN